MEKHVVLSISGLFLSIFLLPAVFHATTLPTGNPDFSIISDKQTSPKRSQALPLSPIDEWYNRAYNRLWKMHPLVDAKKQNVTASPTIDFKNRHFVVLPDPENEQIWFHWKKWDVPRIRIDIFEISGERITSLSQNQSQQKVGWSVKDRPLGIFYYRYSLIGKEDRQLPIQKIVIFH